MSVEIDVMRERGRVEVAGGLTRENVAAAMMELHKVGPRFKGDVLEVNPVAFDVWVARLDHPVTLMGSTPPGEPMMMGLKVIRQHDRDPDTFAVRAAPRMGTRWDFHPEDSRVRLVGTTSSFMPDPRPAFAPVVIRGEENRVGVSSIRTPPALAWGRGGNWFAALSVLHADTGRQAVAVVPVTLAQLELLYGPAPAWVDGWGR
jgi:hypothetical protein